MKYSNDFLRVKQLKITLIHLIIAIFATKYALTKGNPSMKSHEVWSEHQIMIN